MAAYYNTERAEDTLAAKNNRRLRLYRIMAIGLIVLLMGFAIWFYLTASVASKKVLREAKDLRVAMKMLSIVTYSGGKSIYDPTSPDGMVQGVAEKLRQYSDTDGQLILTGWDKTENDALSFRYSNDNYVVIFQKYGEDSEPSWEVYLQLRVTDFS